MPFFFFLFLIDYKFPTKYCFSGIPYFDVLFFNFYLVLNAFYFPLWILFGTQLTYKCFISFPNIWQFFRDLLLIFLFKSIVVRENTLYELNPFKFESFVVTQNMFSLGKCPSHADLKRISILLLLCNVFYKFLLDKVCWNCYSSFLYPY